MFHSLQTMSPLVFAIRAIIRLNISIRFFRLLWDPTQLCFPCNESSYLMFAYQTLALIYNKLPLHFKWVRELWLRHWGFEVDYFKLNKPKTTIMICECHEPPISVAFYQFHQCCNSCTESTIVIVVTARPPSLSPFLFMPSRFWLQFLAMSSRFWLLGVMTTINWTRSSCWD